MKQQLPAMPIEIVGLMRTLRAANQAMSVYLDTLFRPFGASESPMHTLLILFSAEGGVATPRVLCDLVGQTPANMTRILVVLEKLGHISRAVDSGDARRRTIRITVQGKRFMRTVRLRLSGPLKTDMNGFSGADVKRLVALLEHLAVSFDDGERTLRSGGRAKSPDAQRSARKR